MNSKKMQKYVIGLAAMVIAQALTIIDSILRPGAVDAYFLSLIFVQVFTIVYLIISVAFDRG